MKLEPAFKFQGEPIRVSGTADNPLFCAVDVCAVLGIENSRDATGGLDEDETLTVANADGNPRSGIPHQLTYVTESGLYHLIFKSRKPEAKQFRRFVTTDVLPEIRRTGAYLHGSMIDPFQPLRELVGNFERTMNDAAAADARLDEARQLLAHADKIAAAGRLRLSKKARAV